MDRPLISRRLLLAGGTASGLAGGLAGGLAIVLPAAAHHGWRSYGDDLFELTGTVEEVYLGNPHGALKVRAAEGLWEVGLGPPFRNRRAGIEEGIVEPGDEVTAVGKRHRDPDVLEMKTERLIVGGRTYDIYPERLRES